MYLYPVINEPYSRESISCLSPSRPSPASAHTRVLVICVVYSVSNFCLKSRSEIKISLFFFFFTIINRSDYEASLDEEENEESFLFSFFFPAMGSVRLSLVEVRVDISRNWIDRFERIMTVIMSYGILCMNFV